MSGLNQGDNLLNFLGRRPWVVPCFLVVVVLGPSLMTSNSTRSLVFWLGAASIVLSALGALFAETSYRKNRAS